MNQHISTTPCPVQLSRTSTVSHDINARNYYQTHESSTQSGYSIDDDDPTENIDFTTALPRLGVGLKNAKPRRLGQLKAKGKGKGSAFDFAIHEDGNGDGSANGNGNGSRLAGIIARPPQRSKAITFATSTSTSTSTSTVPKIEAISTQPAKTSSRLIIASTNVNANANTTSKRLSQAPRRFILKDQSIPLTVPDLNHHPQSSLPPLPEDTIALPAFSTMIEPTTILKAARRGTIYIPTEDTTMPSMYMGIFSPIKNLGVAASSASAASSLSERNDLNNPSNSRSNHKLEHDGEVEVEVTGIAAQMLAKKKRTSQRQSMVTLSPKRGLLPLRPSVKDVQEKTTLQDRWGQGDGKENVPPGFVDISGKKAILEPSKKAQVVGRPQKKQFEIIASRTSKLHESTASSTARLNDKKLIRSGRPKPGWNAGLRLKIHDPCPIRTITPDLFNTSAEETSARKPPVPTRIVLPRNEFQPTADIFPVLTEDLANLSMYEDNWLHHQEIAITQLVNNLFGASTPARSLIEVEMLRIRLLEKYSSAENALLYKRLQAALSYGALRVPSEHLKSTTQLNNDLGKRHAFTDLWLDIYDLTCLRSALEVVAGRQCINSPGSSSSSSNNATVEHSVSKRALRPFIETFLVRNEDGSPEQSILDRAAWSHQRTILRSLMLIKLLDDTKDRPDSVPSACLFQHTSAHKSSSAVVRALFRQLNPSAGDPIRALNHVGYSVCHSQYPLEEYSYHIENIAVDLRDGVRLTRLVELLLYPTASQSLEYDLDSTTTVLLPTGETVSLTEGEREWPLSQHLKFPCHGRATKLYNVQLALSALQGVKGMPALIQDIEAEDIVDGYREKTVRLLWGLTSKWGLGNLIDWEDVERETKRLCRKHNSSQENDFFGMTDEDGYGYARHKLLLKSWAQALASKRGLVVKNLTTSFADGTVFEAIVDEYEAQLTSTGPSIGRRSLSERLRGLGCSEQFAMLFDSAKSGNHTNTHLFDRDFVLAALTFLCSRLLGSTKGARAAVTIQKGWRSYWARVMHARRDRLKMIAQDCAEVMQGRCLVPGEEDKDRKDRMHTHERLAASDFDEAETELGMETSTRGIANPMAMATGNEDIWLSL